MRYRAGNTILELASQFGISRTTVMAHLDRGAVGRRDATKEWDADTLRRATRLYTGGHSFASVAHDFGIDPTTVAKRLRHAGVPIRSRRGWR